MLRAIAHQGPHDGLEFPLETPPEDRHGDRIPPPVVKVGEHGSPLVEYIRYGIDGRGRWIYRYREA